MRSTIRFTALACLVVATSAFATTRTVTSTSDDISDTGSLRYWIANADPGDTITFDLPSYPAVIQVTNAVNANLDINKSLNIVRAPS
jgi:hypothetical protein